MEILFEVLSVIWITISSLFEGMFTMIIENLPLFMEMKQVLGMWYGETEVIQVDNVSDFIVPEEEE